MKNPLLILVLVFSILVLIIMSGGIYTVAGTYKYGNAYSIYILNKYTGNVHSCVSFDKDAAPAGVSHTGCSSL